MGFFSSLFAGKGKKESGTQSEYMQVIVSQGQRLVEIINESIHLANDSKNVDTKVSRLGIAKDNLKALKKLAGENSFLRLERLDQFETCIKELELEFNDTGYGTRINNKCKTNESISNISEENADVLEGYRLSVSMLPNTPLAILKRHGECAATIPEKDCSLSPAHAIWALQLKTEFSFLSKGSTCWSPVGRIPKDGGDFLPYLISVRNILEQPLTTSSSDFSEALNRLAKIKTLAGGRVLKFDENHAQIESNDIIDYFPLVFKDDKNALNFILDEIGAPSHNGFTMEHLLELHKKGHSSITDMLTVSDDILLSLKGIGKKKLEVIRKNLQ